MTKPYLMSTRKYTFRSVTYQRGNRLWPLQKVCSSEVSLHERTADWHYICTCIRCCPERKQVYVHLLIRILYPGNVGINCKQRLRNATTPYIATLHCPLSTYPPCNGCAVGNAQLGATSTTSSVNDIFRNPMLMRILQWVDQGVLQLFLYVHQGVSLP